MKPLLSSLVPSEFAALVQAAGQPAYRAAQLTDWVHRRGALDWDQLSNLPQALRTRLQQDHDLAGLDPVERQVSSDGTRKFLFRLRDGQHIESVIIPMEQHATFCLSSQVGCGMACSFCATARGGLVRNLAAGEIVEQVVRLRADLERDPYAEKDPRRFNVVYMGMGEPLDNWDEVARSLEILRLDAGMAMSRRRIQISTSGPRAGLEALLAAAPGVGLTLSLGGSDDQERRRIMPVPGRTPVTQAVDLAARYARIAGRRATLAWVLIAGSTDLPEQADRLADLARRGPFKVNLIPMNPLDDSRLDPPELQRMLAFQERLTARGVDAFIRLSGGRDIAAACGQLRRRREGGTG